ncbi:uncharacterized protein [Watersipora subatra]|uniref:uncharacterized protein n=1 Tax=Watersipora subatra TaxID=2589382 RepID=UPI00355BC124
MDGHTCYRYIYSELGGIYIHATDRSTVNSIAMIDVEEYHSQIDGYIKQIISLELLNKVVHKVDLMFNATPGKPVKKQHLIELISPIASAKAKLCISIMVKLNRLTPGNGGCDSMLAVLGNHD